MSALVRFLLPLLAATGCTHGIAMSDYCAQQASAVCADAQLECNVGDLAGCLARDESRCNHILQSPDLVVAINAGTVRWDAAAAYALLQWGDGSGPGIARVSETHSGARHTFNGTLLGTLPIGASCSGTLTDAEIEPCAGGTCVAGRCLRLVNVGESCDPATACVAPLGTFDSPSPSAICVAGTCQVRNGWVGVACSANADCASELCGGGTCQSLPMGASCTSGEACASGACETTCLSAMLRSPCSVQAECPYSLYCDGTMCQSAICADIAP